MLAGCDLSEQFMPIVALTDAVTTADCRREMAATGLCGGLPRTGSRATWRRRQMRKTQLARLHRHLRDLGGANYIEVKEGFLESNPEGIEASTFSGVVGRARSACSSESKLRSAGHSVHEDLVAASSEFFVEADMNLDWREDLAAAAAGVLPVGQKEASTYLGVVGRARSACSPESKLRSAGHSGHEDLAAAVSSELSAVDVDMKLDSREDMAAAVVGVLPVDMDDTLHVSEKLLHDLQDTVRKAEEVTWDMVNKLPFPENIADEEMLVPIAMCGMLRDIVKDEVVAARMGPERVAEAFLQAKEYFDGKPEANKKKPMTAAEWMQFSDEDDDEELYEDEGEEEVNPLDLVYEIIADLSRSGASNDGWVDMANVVGMAGHKSHTVEEAVRIWEDLSVLIRNKENTLVKFLIPLA